MAKPKSAQQALDQATALREAESRIQAAARARKTKLDFGGLRLTRIPDSIGQLTQLQRLTASGCQLTSFPESLGQLVQLRELHAADNQLTALPESLRQLKALRSLDVRRNKINALPEWLGELTNLHALVVFRNRLVALPEWLSQLVSLVELHASHNQVAGLPESLGQLTQLQKLDASHNQLTSLPESLGQLAQLRSLVVGSNELASLPKSLQRLTGLKELFLHHNGALGIPAEVLGPTSDEVHFKGKQPAAPASILNYYFRARRGRRPLNEAKLILVGRGGVGKTCLVNRLLHGKFTHQEETPGVEIHAWEVTLGGERVRLHVWDFGGQRILHGTHQFFLTERTLYLLVLSGREDSATLDAEYWLQLIQSFGGPSRVILALNKIRQHSFDVNRGLLLEKYPALAGFVQTDCADATGIPELHQLICRETDALEHRKADFPAEWFDIKDRLAAMPENFISWEDYQAICGTHGETNPEAQRDLARFLHILGIALYYADDPRLRDTRVLKPSWLTDGIYTLLRAGQREQRGGVLLPSDLDRVLNPQRYPRARHDFLLRLMEKFQLCFRLPGSDERYLVPELLDENQPDIAALLSGYSLGFRYQYEVLPQGLLPRFIVQTHQLSEPCAAQRWRTGVVLTRGGCQAVVRADMRERRVDIHIIGPERARRDLLAIIRERFDEQHRELKGLKVDQRVPIPGEPGVTESYEHLQYLEEQGEEWCWPSGATQRQRIADLLNGVEPRAARRNLHRQSSAALTQWREKLDYLLLEEAKCASAEMKFELQQRITEARDKINALEGDAE